MITCQDIDFSYGREPLFNRLDLSVSGGNIYGLLGMNGAGKTTLLKLISGQLFAHRGTCDVLGYNPANRHPSMLQEIFYLPEEFYLPTCTPSEYLKIYSPFYPGFSRSDFARYAELFDLDPKKNINSYSFGQKKKFLLAFGLASNTSLLILDEPTNGLDIPSKSQFRRTVASAVTEKRAIIISTHQVRDMDQLIDPIIILHNGSILFNQPLAEVEKLVTMKLELQESFDSGVIYSEKVPGGYSVVRKREKEAYETPLDLEVLFNAVIQAPTCFRSTAGENQS